MEVGHQAGHGPLRRVQGRRALRCVETEAYEDEAIRLAGAHDIDIKYRHFRDDAFFAAYFAAMSESYARLTDAYALETLKGAATASTLGTVPDGVPVGWVAIADAAMDIVDIGTPNFALVEKGVTGTCS